MTRSFLRVAGLALAAAFTLALTLTPALHGQGIDLSDASYLDVVDQGKGWYLLAMYESRDDTDPTLAWLVTEEGLDTVPLSPMWLAELEPALRAPADPKDAVEEPVPWVLLDKVLIEGIEAGVMPPGYEEYADPDPEPEGLGCSSQNREASKHWSGTLSPSGSFHLGGGLDGTMETGLPVEIDAVITFRYRVKRTGLLFCVPYWVDPRNVQVTGTATLDGSGHLTAGWNFQEEWHRTWNLLDERVARFVIEIGIFDIDVDINLIIDVGIDAEVSVASEFELEGRIAGTGEFDYTCDRDGCSGTDTFTGDTFGLTDASGGLEADLDARLWGRVLVEGEVEPNRFFTFGKGAVGVKGWVDTDLWGYIGNTCGDADGDGHDETVRALAADIDWGYDWEYRWKFLGWGGDGSFEGDRGTFGWWDVLDHMELGQSTALQPMLLGPAQVNQHGEGIYTVRMRPCYPYDDAVNFTLAPGFTPGGGTIPVPTSSDPAENSVTLSRAFHSAGPVTLTAVYTVDGANREIQVPYSRTVQVVAPPSPPPPPPPPPPPAPEIRVALVGGGGIADGGAYDFGTWQVADLPTSTLFEIANEGTATLTLSNPGALVTGTGFSQIGDLPAASLAPGASTTFRVRFHVGQAGPVSGAVRILSNDADEGSYDIALSGRALAPCVPSATRLCLRGGRFAVDLTYPGGAAQARPFTDLSGFFTFANADNLEAGVKVLAPVNGTYWVFHGPATSQAYTLTVFDTQTGLVRVFDKPAGSFCGESAIGPFPALTGGGPAVAERSALAQGLAPATGGGVLAPLGGSGCVPGSTSVCLNGGRFRVEVVKGGVPQPAVGLTPLSGVFIFANPDNVEVFAKVLGPVNGQFWVFYGSLSNQTFEVRVTDTATDESATYENPAGT